MADHDTESTGVPDDASTVEIEIAAAPSGDVEMEGTAAAGDETPYEKGPVEDAETTVIQEDPVAEARPSFIEYLSSPIVTLLVGQEAQTVLTAHQALLTKSPYFEQLCQSFVDDGSVGTHAPQPLNGANPLFVARMTSVFACLLSRPPN